MLIYFVCGLIGVLIQFIVNKVCSVIFNTTKYETVGSVLLVFLGGYVSLIIICSIITGAALAYVVIRLIDWVKPLISFPAYTIRNRKKK